ncbi:DEAD/DEAH box helicase [Streptococcus gordonii]|uniref:DEAD/DEAH box helicase n=1 Tax=Streptococcus gordonii TaxID=1302 RepID=UPI00077916F3|nr:DEAD/DEAH box helicase [Streptococcus gordonii]MBZ2130558.1 DEAD/DEAH box helicase [Streptococcus gordonii]MCY7129873.1 DEAD/DEAH box helicase [Streptococcus gordonii]MCY7140527.1 DEAD/DEAH box helicase [Streptococcus gordonii]
MAKLIPGKIRTEGIGFYEKGQISISEVKNRIIYSRVSDYNLRYSLADDAVFCSCEFFQKKQYCAHLAGLEYFLKNDAEGKEVLAKLELEETSQQETQGKVSFGSLFLDKILPLGQENPKYQLSAVGQEDAYTGVFLWTLRLRRLPDEKSYVVRDIRAFLQTIQKEAPYQIGKSYFEPLRFEEFDRPSQDLLMFLRGFLTTKDDSLIFQNAGRHIAFPASLLEEGVTRLMELNSFHLAYSVFDFQQVFFQDLHEDAGIFSFELEESADYLELVISEQYYKLLYNGEFLFYGDTFFQLSYQQQRILAALRDLPIDSDRRKRLQFDSSDQGKLATSLLEFKKMGSLSAPKELMIHEFQPRFSFDLLTSGEIEAKLVFVYESLTVASQEELDSLPFASDFRLEQKVFQTLLQAGFEAAFESRRPALLPQDVYTFFTHTMEKFRSLGRVEISPSLLALYQVEKPKIAIETKGSLLEIGFDFANIAPAEVDDALSALFESRDYFVSQSGKVLVFDEETKKVSQTLQKLRAKKLKGGQIRTNRLAALQLTDILEDQENVSFSEGFRQLAYDLRHPEEFQLPSLQVEAELRDYQELGVKWLSMLNHYGFGGILADDMGLGKTLQTIAFLTAVLRESKNALILAPSSLVYNWQDEFGKFAPHLDIAVVYGPKPLRDNIIDGKHQVMITSYASFRQDVEEYGRLSFDYLILDEAQVMKNDRTKIAQHLRNFEVKNTFALSGTPIENHMGELWSIFQIVLPGLLPTKKEFLKMPADLVARYVQPFIMRRKKEDVLQELPDLTEVVYRNDLQDSQKAIYLAQLQQMQERMRSATDEELNRDKIEILSGLMRLRQICDTPALFLEDYQGDSGKLDSLRELLEQIHSSNHRVLIFSQFRGMLDLIEQELQSLEMESFKITGSTPAKDRQEMTTAFNDGQKDAFLISLKAGGVGLNLTGADTVILVDLWWNPAVEAQAIGRAHRMGQERNVEVYRLITRGTIEEKIQELQESKKNLISTILDGTESRSSLTLADIREILGISIE